MTARRRAEIVFIITPDRPDLHEYVSRGFADVPQVKVMYDRRRGERRRAAEGAPAGGERRRGDRRSHAERDDLRGLGWALVRVEDGAGG